MGAKSGTMGLLRMCIDHEPRPELGKKPSRDTFPAVELLLKADSLANVWPPEVAQNPEFVRQVGERNVLKERLNVVLEALPRPDVSLEVAVSLGLLTESQVSDVYASLGELLKDGSEYQRIALYLPFEFLPTTGHEDFRKNYMAAWNRLLNVHDVRANFVDGDVLEVEKREGDLPRVVKAAHLIPQLIEKGWLDIYRVIGLLRNSNDEILQQSISDTIPVLVDKQLIDKTALGRLAKLGIASVDAKLAEAKTSKPERVQPTGLSYTAIEQQLRERFAEIDAVKTGYDGMTQKRVAWLKGEKKRKAIQTIANMIRTQVVASSLDDASRTMIAAPEADVPMQQAFVEGVRDAIEVIAKTDEATARARYHDVHDVLIELWKRNVPAVRDVLAKCFLRLNGLHIVSDDETNTLGIGKPALSGPFSQNLERMHDDMRDMKALVGRMEKDPILATSVYSAMLVFGSRLKGYGAVNADIDVAVFVKPGVDAAMKDELREHLRIALQHDDVRDDAVEFWLKEDDGKLRIDDPASHDPHIGESHFTHILFGAAWEGDAKAIRELRAKLLAPYFADDGKELFGRSARRLYIEEMERDVLQYRLMHKGYERFMSSFGGVTTPHASSVDGASAFWDSGYRQTATKLFVSNVFLPKLI
ncbi:MAG: nucleotidyltransferase domain-containing protein [Candidatus Uhrbacteria bacterium]|nr:nucleotidyltransferase domain-containing protein [Candidatus Uhrbacteria bacterium]